MSDKEKNHHPPSHSPVSIVGYSLRAPDCSSVAEFAKALEAGEDLTTSDTRYPSGLWGLPPRQGRLRDSDLNDLTPTFFGLSRKMAEKMDPAIRLLLKVSYEALMDAQIDIESIRGSRTGVYAGHCFCDLTSIRNISDDVKLSSFSGINGYEILGTAHCMAANRLSYFYDLKGPSMTMDTACSSSLLALDRAARDIKTGIIERALVCGISLTLDHTKNVILVNAQMLSKTGHCHVFDSRADGYCRADGVACVVLERGSRGYAQIVGSGTNQDGATAGITFPSSAMQYTLMSEVFSECEGVDPKDVVYHEAHGTGTVAGDQQELIAMSKIFQQGSLVTGSVKSNMGHSEGASGLMGIVKILLMMEDHKLYPNHDFQETPHEAIKSGKFLVLRSSQAWEPGICSISNFGFGGSNVFMILKPCPERRTVLMLPKTLNVTPFSAAPGSDPLPIHSDFYAIQRAVGNDRPFRFHFKKDEWDEASPLVFVCDGQGSQWNNMGEDLMKESHVFRTTIERLERETGVPLVSMYEDGTCWMQKRNSPIGIVSFQLGIIAILAEQGIEPDYYLGHSLGEIACAYLAGFQTEAQALMTAQVRSELVSMIDKDSRLDIYAEPSVGCDYEIVVPSKEKQFAKKVPHDSPSTGGILKNFSMMGKMAAVGYDADTIEAAIEDLGLNQTVVACYNSPRTQTVSGTAAEVNQLLEYLQKKNPDVFLRDIPTDNIAYHAPYLEVFRETLRARFLEIGNNPQYGQPCLRAPRQLPSSWISTSRNRMFGVNYLLDNICHPVHFQEAIKSLPKGATVVEIGPASGLLAQIRRSRSDLKRIALVERETPVDVAKGLAELQAWKTTGDEKKPVDKVANNKALHYTQRYPQLWGEHTKFLLPTWENFEHFQKTVSTVKEVIYDLTKEPWSSIRDHCLRGQCLFPAAGFIHILWSAAAFKERTEILDFRVWTPLVLSRNMKKVELHLHRAGQYCEVRDTMNEICYAVGRVQPVASFGTRFEEEVSLEEDGDGTTGVVSSKTFYDLCDYGPKYRLLKTCTTDTGTMSKPSDFIAYTDACVQLISFTETLASYPEGVDRRSIPFPIETQHTYSFPVGFDRIVFWEKDLDKAALWLRQRGTDTVGNRTVLLEGLRREYVQFVHRPAAIHSEMFIEYKATDDPISPTLVAEVLMRESLQYHVVEPLLSDDLKSVIKILQDHALAKEVDSCKAVVFSDKFEQDAELLVTTDTLDSVEVPFCLVARWGNVRLVRIGDTSVSSMKVISEWSEVPPAPEPFIWQGDGSSGAATSLSIERRQTVASYSSSSSCSELIGREKGMRLNFVLERDKDLCHGVWVDVKQAEVSQEQYKASTPFAQLRILKPGVLDSLEWTAIDPEMYPVKVETAALNFRDIMRALGKLKERDLSLGHEFSGFDTATQQRVFGLGMKTFASHCHAGYSFPVPDHLSHEEAVTIPLVYLTAYYAMLEKADMKRGQSILIHAGAGGVGIAAITIALKRGVKVFTTCSASKREFLKDRFGLTDEQIGDSRTDSFVQTVLEGTKGVGVDIVLNQLAGPAQIASLRCVAGGGIFLEIGKLDAHMNSRLGQALLANNISFHIIDLGPLVVDTSYKPMWDKFLIDGFSNNEIVPLPTTIFDAGEIGEALRFMSQAKHLGKIVITGFGKQHFKVHHLPDGCWKETHLITGGLGGLGFALATRLACNGSPELILVGRKGVTTAFQRLRIKQLERLGCKITVIAASVLDLTGSSCSTPDRIWHTANVYHDVKFDEMTGDHWDAVVGTKVDGYRHLRKCWPSTPIVAISSVVGYFGNLGQVHYASANATLDEAGRRDANTISVRLGALDNVGYAVQSETHRRLLQRSPFELMPIEDVLDRLMQITSEHQSGVFGIYDLKRSKLGRKVIGSDEPYTLEDAQKMLADILGGTPEQYYPTLSLTNSGLDSLSLMEVVYHIHEVTGVEEFKPSEVNEDFLVQDIVTFVMAARGKQSSGQKTVPTSDTLPKEIPADVANEKTPDTTSTSGSDSAKKSVKSEEPPNCEEPDKDNAKASVHEDLPAEEGPVVELSGHSDIDRVATSAIGEPLEELQDLLNTGGIGGKSLNELHQLLMRSGLGQKPLEELLELIREQDLGQRIFTMGAPNQLLPIHDDGGWSSERKIAAACLLVPAIWWIILLATHGVGDADKVLLYALAVFNLFLLVRLLVDSCILKGAPIREPVSCAHFVHHLIEIAIYVILYTVGSDDDFIIYWQSVFFGYYFFDTLSVLAFWPVLIPDFRVFLVIHHGLAFFFTGLWRFQEQLWDQHLALGIVLWLTAGVWQHGLMVYRHFNGPRNVLREYLPFLFIFTFAWERIQRIAAYFIVALLVESSSTDDEKAMFAGTVFLLDFVDIWFQVKSIRKQLRHRAVTQEAEQEAAQSPDSDLREEVIDLV